jgi:uncharacterized protein
MDFLGARNYIINRLMAELNPKLTYHNLEHTLDVCQGVVRLSELESYPADQRILLDTAALFHDSGMLVKYRDHEEASVGIAREILPGYGYSTGDIREIAALIKVTTLPQQARTDAEKIICDADLDSFGRDDFFIQSFQLKLEWENFGIRRSSVLEWLSYELDFLESHKYFTPSAIKLRDEKKKRNIMEIKELLKRS